MKRAEKEKYLNISLFKQKQKEVWKTKFTSDLYRISF